MLDLSKTGNPESYMSAKLYEPQRKNDFTGAAEITFLPKVDTQLKLP